MQLLWYTYRPQYSNTASSHAQSQLWPKSPTSEMALTVGRIQSVAAEKHERVELPQAVHLCLEPRGAAARLLISLLDIVDVVEMNYRQRVGELGR